MITEDFMEVDAWVFRPLEAGGEPLPADATRSRTILRRVLALRLGHAPEEIEFTAGQHGKPGVRGCEFSLSHSGPWLVIVTGEAELGVDVETRVPRRVMELAERFFSPADAAALRQAEHKPHSFLAQWVAKEAALKAAGIGIAGGLQRATCTFEGKDIREVAWDAERFSIQQFALSDGTPGAIAWRRGPAARVRWRDAADAGLS